MAAGAYDMAAMLDAHVRFELDRLTGAGLEQDLEVEVAAAFDVLGTVPLADLVTAQALTDAVLAIAAGVPAPDTDLPGMADGALNAAREVLAERKVTLGDLVHRDHVDLLVELLAGMHGVRREVMNQVTGSAVYTRLLSHVLYQGLKGYLLNENVLARRIPGAGALVRLGQRGLSSAAPNLEKGIDRQLTAFVAANVADSVQDSQHYLEGVLDASLVIEMAAASWESTADRSIAELTDLVEPGQGADLVTVLATMWRHLADTEAFSAVVAAGCAALLVQHGHRPTADVLADLGVTPDVVSPLLVAAVRPAVLRSYAAGYLQERVRARLAPFYAAYQPATAAKPPAKPPAKPAPAKPAPAKPAPAKPAPAKPAPAKPSARRGAPAPAAKGEDSDAGRPDGDHGQGDGPPRRPPAGGSGRLRGVAGTAGAGTAG